MARNRRPNWRSVKRHYSLTVEEAARTLGVHKGTVRRWLKSGLPALTDRKPVLILGDDLIEWLKSRRGDRLKCAADELYCLKCRCPQKAAGRVAELLGAPNGGGNLRAFCEACGTRMHRRVGAAQVAGLDRHFDITGRQAPPDITERIEPSLNVHFAEGSEDRA